MPLICHQFSYHDDNYGFLLHDPETGHTAAIDAGCAASYQEALDETGYELTHIFITHHHWDHTDGLAQLKKAHQATVIGPSENTKSHIRDLIDMPVVHQSSFQFGRYEIQVIATPGHTLDMVNYYCAEEDILFSGDSLFVLGCGRIFEGNPSMMWQSLSSLKSLPPSTIIYSAHEYAESNAAFAAVIEPDNLALNERIKAITAKRKAGQPTVPSLLSEELDTNPFLRADLPQLQSALDMTGSAPQDVFAAIRARKDKF